VPFRDVEAVLVGVGSEARYRRRTCAQALLVLLAPDVAQALEEEETEDVVLVVAGIDAAAEDVGGWLPEVLLQLRLLGCPLGESACKVTGKVEGFRIL
jgi:hypothetical protein